jgi:hypothetical protein
MKQGNFMKQFFLIFLFQWLLLAGFPLLPHSGSILWAQDICTQNLEDARRRFEEGRYYEIENLLEDCINSGFTRQERIESLHLLTTTYLYLDRMEEADSSYLYLLTIDPEHQVNPVVDPPDLVFLHESFRTKPIFAWNVSIGINQPIDRIIYDYSAYGDSEKKSSVRETGIMAGVGISFYIVRNLTANMEGRYMRSLYIQKEEFLNSIYQSQRRVVMDFASVPVYFKYEIMRKGLKPYFFAGMMGNFLLASRYDNLVRSGSTEEITQNEFDFGESASFLNYSLLAGAGVMLKTSGIEYFAMELSYGLGMNNYTNELKRYASSDLQREIINFGTEQDAYRLDHIMLNIKFIRPFYKPKKLDLKKR